MSKNEKVLLALDMSGVEVDYVDKIGKVWRVVNALTQSKGWQLEVLLYRRECPEVKAMF